MPCAQIVSLAEDSEQLQSCDIDCKAPIRHLSLFPANSQSVITIIKRGVAVGLCISYLIGRSLHSWNVAPPRLQSSTVQYNRHESYRYPETSPIDLADVVTYRTP